MYEHEFLGFGLDNDDIAFSLAELSGASGHSDNIAMVFSQYGCMRSNSSGFLSCVMILTDISRLLLQLLLLLPHCYDQHRRVAVQPGLIPSPPSRLFVLTPPQ